jgi:XXXCH domain-containing protein
MAPHDVKIEESFQLAQLPQFFRDLAQRLENAELEAGSDPDQNWTDFNKIRIRVKRAGTRVDVKLKVKQAPGTYHGPTGPATTAGTGKVSYKKLKKRMDKTFDRFSQDLKGGLVPVATILEGFRRDAEKMVTYEDKGRPYYDAFMKACTDFLDACAQGDVSAAQVGYRRLDNLKSACHDRYK